MKPSRIGVVVLAAWLGALGSARAADRTTADVACRPTGKELIYLCRIELTDQASGQPLAGIDLTVGADMPSMPMAHNVRAVPARPLAAGTYEAELELEMHGDWALRLRLAGARNDLIVRRLRFEPQAVTPVR